MNARTHLAASRRLRVLLVTEPGVDGVFRHVEGLADHLLSHGHSVDLAFSARRAGPDLARLVALLVAAGGEAVDLDVGNGPAPSDVPALARLQALVRRRRPVVIHAHSSKAGALVRLLPWIGEAHLFYTPHAYFGLRPGAHWQGRFYNRLERHLGRRGTTINVSESEAGFAATVLRIPIEARVTVSNGVPVKRFRPASAAERTAARSALGLPPTGLVLACVARLCFQKDPETLYRGLARVRAAGLPVHLLHVGHGETPGAVGELLAGELRGHVTRRTELDPVLAYHASDGLIVTSRYEGLSLVVLEALACGLPLVLSEVPGNDDILRHRPSQAYAFPAGDVAAMGVALQRWAAGATVPPVNNHRELACRHFDRRRSFQLIERIYQHGPQSARRPAPAAAPLPA